MSPAEVRSHLADILESPPFRSSQRSRQFLEYAVAHTLDARHELLKERSIGENIFGRAPDYDTGQDSIVRVKANEVRRRLAQYYDLHPHSPLRLEMPSGCYLIQARWAEQTPSAPAPPAPAQGGDPPAAGRPRWRMGLAAGAVLSLALLAFIWRQNQPAANQPFDRFWEPFVDSSERLVICLPTPETFRVYGRDRAEFLDVFKPRKPGSPRPAAAGPLGDVTVVPEPGMFLGIGDARALTLIHSLAVRKGGKPEVRLAGLTSFSELRSSPSVLIGGFTNRWTLDLTRGLRYAFTADANGRNGIRDSRTGEIVCSRPQTWETPSEEDCAIITRLVHSAAGQPILVAAGLNHFGTFAVGEFLTNGPALVAALNMLAAGWENKNLQVVFSVKTMRDDTGPPRILGVHSW